MTVWLGSNETSLVSSHGRKGGGGRDDRREKGRWGGKEAGREGTRGRDRDTLLI